MKNFIRILKFAKPYWLKAISNIICNLITSIFSLVSLSMVIPFLGVLFGTQEKIYTAPELNFSFNSIIENFYYYITKIIDHYGEKEALFCICLLVLIMFFFRNLFRYLALFFLTPIRNGIVKDIRSKLHKATLSFPIKFFKKNKKGDLISKMTSDLVEIEWSIMSSLELIFKEPITILIFLVALINLSPQLTFFVVLLFPLTGFLIAVVGKNLKKSSEKGQNQMGRLVSNIEQNLSGLKVIKVFGIESYIQNKFENNNNKYNIIMNKILRKKDLSSPMSEFLSTIVLVCIMWFGGQIVLNDFNYLSPEQFIGYIVIFSQIIPPAKSLTTAYYRIQKGSGAAKRVYEIFDEEKPNSVEERSISKTDFKNEISFNNVSFGYEKENVLKNINFSIEKGQTIAIVGSSGSGKSTIINLLSRLYDIENGEIKIDNINIKDIKLSDLRRLISLVFQDSILFNDSILNNIRIGKIDATKEEVIEAAKIANAHDFIMNINLNYNYNIGDKGDNLSGGEKQRICIARAIIRRPEILILDEATSSLDNISEKNVQAAINNVIKNRTCLIIAHRISTIKNADKIIVLENGEIVEYGKHEELLAKKQYYYNLYHSKSFK
tara:strand:+ start:1509 stop:3329 length:1821 start_codon:yes stop_codon:yes gene_type:complete